jgi:lysyl-tRNA synthetase class 2
MSESDQYQQRLKKLDGLRAMGIDPYGGRIRTTHSIRQITTEYESHAQERIEKEPVGCSLAGRIMTLRRFGKAGFAHLQDGTGRLQVYFKKDRLGEKGFALYDLLDIGDLVGCTGRLFRTKTGELTLEVGELVLLAKSLHPLPEKWHGLTDVEVRYRQRYLDLISNPEVREIFVKRGRIVEAVREFLKERDFIEVETPMMQPIPGGAAARPFVTHHNALDVDLYLRIAPELYLKRLIIGGLERVYEINRNFRNEGISTVHNPEFTMLEFYMTHADYQDLMGLTEALISRVAKKILDRTIVTSHGHEIDLTPPWKRLMFEEAILVYSGCDSAVLTDRKKALDLAQRLHLPIKGTEPHGKLLQEIFEATVEDRLIQPTFILDYPIEISPLAKRKSDRPDRVERFELFIGGREIANAFTELNDPLDQRQRFKEQVRQRTAGDLEAHPLDEDYLRALEYGMPQTAGEGIGMDRLVMLLTNQPSIRDVILFPHLRPEKS